MIYITDNFRAFKDCFSLARVARQVHQILSFHLMMAEARQKLSLYQEKRATTATTGIWNFHVKFAHIKNFMKYLD